MADGFKYRDPEGPAPDGAVFFGFLLIVAISLGAFVWAADVDERFAGTPVRVYQQAAAPETATSDSSGPGVDAVSTSAVGRSRQETKPLCDVNACAEAYRSFRVSDCTFQPFEGPRRLCRR